MDANNLWNCERAFLAYFFTGDRELIKRAIELPDSVFYDETHRQLFAAIKTCYHTQDATDIATISAYLDQVDKLHDLGGFNTLKNIMDTDYVRSPQSLASVMQLLKNAQANRELESYLIRWSHAIQTGKPPEQLFVEIRNSLDLLAPAKAHKSTVKRLDLLRHLPDESWLKAYFAEVAYICDLPESSTLIVGLSSISNAVCRRYAASYSSGDKIAGGIYAAVAQPVGVGKSRLLRIYTKTMEAIQKQAIKNYNAIHKEWKNKGLDERGEPPKEPIIFIKTDVTSEGMDKSLLQSSGFFGLASSEQGLTNTLLGATYGNGRKNNNDLILKGYLAEYHYSERSTRGGYTGEVVGSVTCITQSDVINTIIEQSNGQGIAERFILLDEASFLGTRDHTAHKPAHSLNQRNYDFTVESLINPVKLYQDDFDQLPQLHLSKEAYHRLALKKNEYEPQLADGARYSHGIMRGIVAKYDQRVLKIALNLYVLNERAQIKDLNAPIPGCWVDAAMGIADDLIEYTLYLLEKGGYIGLDAQQDDIIAFMSSKHGKTTRSAIVQAKARVKLFAETGDATKAIHATISSLIRLGIISETTEKGLNGKSRTTLTLAQ